MVGARSGEFPTDVAKGKNVRLIRGPDVYALDIDAGKVCIPGKTSDRQRHEGLVPLFRKGRRERVIGDVFVQTMEGAVELGISSGGDVVQERTRAKYLDAVSLPQPPSYTPTVSYGRRAIRRA